LFDNHSLVLTKLEIAASFLWNNSRAKKLKTRALDLILRAMSKPTTMSAHVLDTSIGTPAKELQLVVQKLDDSGNWNEIKSGSTNSILFLFFLYNLPR
jgi:hypothetical protein